MEDITISVILPNVVSVFYENNIPYLKYIGEAIYNNGMSAQIQIPKISLAIKNISIINRTMTVKFEALRDFDLTFEEREIR